MNSCNISTNQFDSFKEKINTVLSSNNNTDDIIVKLYELIRPKPYKDEYLSLMFQTLDSRVGENPTLDEKAISSLKEENDKIRNSINKLLLKSREEKQCQLESLNLQGKHINDLYFGHSSAINRMHNRFKTRMLQSSIIDVEQGIIVESDHELNENIRKFKIELLNNIITYINEQIEGKDLEALPAYAPNGLDANSDPINPDFYAYVMSYGGIIGELIDNVRSGKTPLYEGDFRKQTKTEKIYNDLVILNNFDYLVDYMFDKIVSVDPVTSGYVDDMSGNKYELKLFGLQNMLWSAESLDAKDIRHNVASLTKLLITTIHKTVNGHPKKDEFLNVNELNNISTTLKKLESELLVKKRQYVHGKYQPKNDAEEQILKKDISFNDSPVLALRTLIEYAQIIDNKQYNSIIDPLRVYLYEGITDEKGNYLEHPIREIQKDDFEYKADIHDSDIANSTNIEALFAYELLKSVPVIYTSYYNGGRIKYTDVAGSYFAPNEIKNNIIEGINTILSNLNSGVFNRFINNYEVKNGNNSYTSQNIIDEKKKDVNNPLFSELLYSPQLTQDFRLLFGIELNEDFVSILKSYIKATDGDALEYIMSFMDQIRAMVSGINSNKDKIPDIRSAIEKNLDSLSKSNKYYQAITKAVTAIAGKKPITTITDSNDNKIPVYRLSSTGFEDTYYIQQYLKKHGGDDNTNVLARFPGLFSGEGNVKYTTSTAIRLEAVRDEDSSNNKSGNKMNIIEAFKASFAGDFISLMMENGIFGSQIMTYSDKVSIILKLFNAETDISSAFSTNETGITLKNIDNERLFALYFTTQNLYYEKVFNNILKKWNIILSNYNRLYNNTYEKKEINTWLDLQEFMNHLNRKANENKMKPMDLLRNILLNANAHIELTDQLDYMLTQDKKLHINNSLRLHYDLTRKDNIFKDVFIKTYEREFIEKIKKYGIGNNIKDILPPQYRDKLNDVYTELGVSKGFKDDQIYDEESFELNPLVKKYLLLTNMLKDSYLGITVKHPYIHVIKKFNDIPKQDDFFKVAEEKGDINLSAMQNAYDQIMQDESERVKAAMKRMVILPATKECYAQKLLNGVPKEYNISVIEDDEQEVFNFKGESDGLKVYDGSSWENPFMSVLEETSLIAKGIRGTKKPIGMYSGNGYALLCKYAQFPITNRKIIDTIGSTNSLLNMMKKMNSIKFTDDNGYCIDKYGRVLNPKNPIQLDITRNFLGIHINPGQLNKNKGLYFREGTRYYKILDLEKDPTKQNNYIITLVEVDKNGNETTIEENGVKKPLTFTRKQSIQTIYELWMALGGYNSVELKNGELDFSEDSIYTVVQYMNNVGIPISRQRVQDGDISQETLYQPLKHAMIHMIANASAVKNGQTNINSVKSWTSEYDANNKNTHLLYFTVDSAQFGSQMDGNHESDDAELTEMSQVITALAANGISTEEAKEAYSSIADIIELSIKNTSQQLKIAQEGNLQKVGEQITNDIIKQFKEDDKISISDAIYNTIQRQGNKILPYNDPNFYNLFISSVIANLSNNTLRRKYPGIAAILNPSAKMHMVYDIEGKTFMTSDAIRTGLDIIKNAVDSIKNIELKEAITKNIIRKLTDQDIVNFYIGYLRFAETNRENEYLQYLFSLNNIDELRNEIQEYLVEQVYSKMLNLYDTYSLNEDSDVIYIDTLEKLKEAHENNIIVVKHLNAKRDLRPVTITYDTDLGHQNVFTDEINELSFTFDRVVNEYRKIKNSENKLQYIENAKQDDKIKSLFDFLKNYNIEGVLTFEDFFKKIGDKSQSDIYWFKKKIKQLRDRQFELLHYGFSFNPVWIQNGEYVWGDLLEDIDIEESINDNNIDKYINRPNQIQKVYNVNIQEAEMIAPKVFRSLFGIDQKSQVQIDKNFFINKLKQFDYPDIKSDLQIVTKNDSYEVVFVKDIENVGRKYGDRVRTKDGYAYDSSGKKIFAVPQNVYAYEKQTSHGKIVTFVIGNDDSNKQKYLKQITKSLDDFLYITIGKTEWNKQEEKLKDLVDLCYNLNYIPFIKQNYRTFNNLEKIDESIINQFNSTMSDELGNMMYSSYMMSNHTVSARIPSQALQSFMSMKIVAYTDDESNNAFVSIWQPYLQGSDFDIDKAYNLMYSFSNSGLYEHWSPLFDFSSYESLQASEWLPAPDKNHLVKIDGDDSIQTNISFLLVNNEQEQDKSFFSILFNNYVNSSNEIDKIKIKARIIKYINSLDTNKSVTIRVNEVYQDILQDLVSQINEHQTYEYGDGAARNLVVSNVRKTINDFRNMDSAYSPVSMSCFLDPIKKLNIDSDVKNIYDGFTVFEITEENNIGRDTVGVMANGTKVFFTITQYLNKYYQKTKDFKKTDPQVFFKDIKLKLNDGQEVQYQFSTISDIKLNKQQRADLMELFRNTFSEQQMQRLSFIDDDASLVISALVSLATDNAKELGLAKMNANLDLASMHVYLTILGVDPSIIVKYTTTKLFKQMAATINPDILTTDHYNGSRTPNFTLLSQMAQDANSDKLRGSGEWTKEDVEQLKEIYYASKELKDLASILGINQGLTAKIDGLYSLKDRLGRAWLNMLKQNEVFLDNSEAQKAIKRPRTNIRQNYGDVTKLDFSGCNPLKIDLINDVKHLLIDSEVGTSCLEALKGNFDFNMFFENDKYREFIIKTYDMYKHTFNVYDIVNDSENFGAMLRASQIVTKFLSTVSKKFDFQFNKARQIYERGYDKVTGIGYTVYNKGSKEEQTINPKQGETGKIAATDSSYRFGNWVKFGYTVEEDETGEAHSSKYIKNITLPKWDSKMAIEAGRYWDDMIVRNFLLSGLFNEGGDYYIDVNYLSQKADLKNAYQIYDQHNPEDKFNQFKFIKAYVEKILIPRLTASDPENEFLKSIALKYDKADMLTKYQFKVSMNDLSDPNNLFKRDMIQFGFNKIAEMELNINEDKTVTVGDILYLYHLIVNKNRMGQYSLNAMFGEYINNPNNLIGNKFIEFQTQNMQKDLEGIDEVDFMLYMLKRQLSIKDKESGNEIGKKFLMVNDKEYRSLDQIFVSETPSLSNIDLSIKIDYIMRNLLEGGVKLEYKCD